MDKMIAPCGLDCIECPAYVATQENDIDALQKMAAEASAQFGMDLATDDVKCDGCMSDGRKIGYCDECGIRACVINRDIPNCAHCPEYGCSVMTAFTEKSEGARTGLEAIRAELGK